METLTDFKLSATMRRIITRVINTIPILVAIYAGIEPLQILVLSQVVLSVMIPLPLIHYASKKEVMGEFVNRKITTIAAALLALIIIAFSLYLLQVTFLRA